MLVNCPLLKALLDGSFVQLIARPFLSLSAVRMSVVLDGRGENRAWKKNGASRARTISRSTCQGDDNVVGNRKRNC